MTTAIRVSDLGKSYRVQHAGQIANYQTLREGLVNLSKAPMRRLRGDDSGGRSEEFWALKDVDFEVQTGEVVGIIGRNGAGKSTLLKVLSRITKPTIGRVELNGRVGSLLEVGTGFHPELTGRENIFLNGSILGMRRGEIARKFDEIVAFSEVERFLDTPVKRYSSGMYVRLAFSVAAFLTTDILLLDEVLAVGDTGFQKKCIGKMGDLSRQGRTVILISHNMSAIMKLTERSVFLEKGRVITVGKTNEVISEYLSMGSKLDPIWRRESPIEDDQEVVLTAVRACEERGRVASRFSADLPFSIEIDFLVRRETNVQIAFRLNRNEDSSTVFTTALSDQAFEPSSHLKPGDYTARCRIPSHYLRPGSYHLLVAANNPKGEPYDLIEQVLEFEVTDIGSLARLDNRLGIVSPLLSWDLS